MSATLTVGNVTLGEGMPKIIVSIMGDTEESILSSAQKVAEFPEIVLAEWRADHFCDALSSEKTLSVLQKIRAILPGKPLIYTFRTAREGGQAAISPADYIRLCEATAASQLAALIDVEMFFEEAALRCVQAVHAHNGKVIGSWHNFSLTPSEHEIIDRFRCMQHQGADVLKMAVMPNSEQDVSRFVAAVQQVRSFAKQPLCAIAMGELGRETRISGEAFGSCLTFGAVGEASAPGQVPVTALHEALCAVHRSISKSC